jgi:hypothetical protein
MPSLIENRYANGIANYDQEGWTGFPLGLSQIAFPGYLGQPQKEFAGIGGAALSNCDLAFLKVVKSPAKLRRGPENASRFDKGHGGVAATAGKYL